MLVVLQSRTTSRLSSVRIAARSSLPPGGDYFSVFALVPQLDLDLGMLEHQFHKLSRKLHPDRFARAQENEKQWSLADTALLNDAYRTLRESDSPHGISPEVARRRDRRRACRQRSQGQDPSRVPADLLEEAFDLNMQLEEMRMARRRWATRIQNSSRASNRRRKNSIAMLDEVDSDLRAQWKVWDNGENIVRDRNRRKKWWLCSIGGATSATLFAT